MHGMPDYTKLDQPQDTMANSAYHYSLCNTYEQDRPADIFLKHLQSGQYQDRHGTFTDKSGCWQSGRVIVFLRQCTIALQLTLVATYIWGGQPPRGPELCQITFRNGRNQIRNLFWACDRLAIHQPYNKSASITEDGKGITRFTPIQLCLPLIRFLLYVRPAIPALYEAIGIEFSPNNYLFRSYTPRSRGGGPLPSGTQSLSQGL